MSNYDLPIEAVLPALCETLRSTPNAVLEAPPGAGKTTRVPLALWQEPWVTGRIVMLEPRRLAARAAARRMADTLGEKVGDRVGFRTRGNTRVSAKTRIEVVTEGILARMAIADPALDGISAVIFDEIHERNIHSDFALAICIELQAALRPELRLIAMSATLDAAPIAAAMGDAPVIRSKGRLFEVETQWATDSLPDRRPATLAPAVTERVLDALDDTDGAVLAFLPGAAEINRAASALRSRLPASIPVQRLYGAAPQAEQAAALSPHTQRRVVIASAIAETSLTVPGVRVVVDAGAARRARFDPASGMSRLVTERVTRAEADQRRGRAGREGPGLCIRLWTRGEHGALHAYAPPEITIADLAPLVLDCAAWGSQPTSLPFLDQPPVAALAEAQALLATLGAFDRQGRLTAMGRSMADLPLHPRLAAMVLGTDHAKPTARLLAALLNDGDPLREAGTDLAQRLKWLSEPERAPAAIRPSLRQIRKAAARLGPLSTVNHAELGPILARAYPDRVAQRRPGDQPRWLLSNGKGAWLPADDILAGVPYLVVADLDGDQREARIRLAAGFDRRSIEDTMTAQIDTVPVIAWEPRDRRVLSREETRLGALILASRRIDRPDPEAVVAAMLDGIARAGLEALPWTQAARGLRARVIWARENGVLSDLPDWSDDGLEATMGDWLSPWLCGITNLRALEQLDLLSVLRAALGQQAARLDVQVPSKLVTPVGRTVTIDYGGAMPSVGVRPQWLYGLDEHPSAGGRSILLELRSPADRPIALTQDLAGFWRRGWLEVRKDMRGRYPRHDWPETPWLAAPHLGAKPRA